MPKLRTLLTAALLVPLLVAIPVSVIAQDQTGSIHGRVTRPEGTPMTDAIIILTPVNDKTAKYTFNADANGDYKGSGIAPGSYGILLRAPDTPPDKVVDQVQEIKITAGTDTLQNFDLSRPDYISKLSPEQQKALADLKAKNAGVMKENAVIKNLNANLQKARDDDKAGNYAEADQLMTQATQAKPEEALLWFELGKAQNGEKKYDDAVTSLQKAVDLNSKAKKPDASLAGAANGELGTAYASQKKFPDAQSAYEAAAKADPAQAASYYQNEAIVMDRAGNVDGTVAAADKAIAADPTKPIPYYLKGKALINKATVDQKTGKIVAPPGCAEAYQKYLELAPQGQFAPEVTQLLTEMGQTIKSSFKAKKS